MPINTRPIRNNNDDDWTTVNLFSDPGVDVRDVRDMPKVPADDGDWTTVDLFAEKAPVEKKGTIGAFAKTLARVPENLAAKTIMAIQGQAGASVADKGIADRFVSWVDERNRRLAEEYTEAGDFIPGVITRRDVAELGPNLAFSGVSMGGTIAGGLAAAPVPVPGARIAGGLAGGASAAYRMDTYQVMNDWLKQVNQESIDGGLGPISKEEEKKFKKDMSALATEHGAWEAGPEGFANILQLALLTAKNVPGARWIPEKLTGKVAKGALRFAGILGAEQATETITQMGQQRAESKAGMTGEAPREWTSGADILKSAKEVMPQVLLMAGFMSAGGAAYRKVTKPESAARDELLEDYEKDATAKEILTRKEEVKQAKAEALEAEEAEAALAEEVPEREPVIPEEKPVKPKEEAIEDDKERKRRLAREEREREEPGRPVPEPVTGREEVEAGRILEEAADEARKTEPEVIKKESIKFVGTRKTAKGEFPIFEDKKGFQVDYKPAEYEISNIAEYEAVEQRLTKLPKPMPPSEIIKKESWEITKEKDYGGFIKDIVDKGETVGDKKDVIAEMQKRMAITEKNAFKYYNFLIVRKKAIESATKRGKNIDIVFDDEIHTSNYWLTTQQEYIDISYTPKTQTSDEYDVELAKEDHKAFVEEALENNKPVPKEVLKDYPGLVATKPLPTKPPKPTPPEVAEEEIKAKPIPEVGEVSPKLLERQKTIEKKIESLKNRIDRAEKTAIPGTFVTGRENVPRSRIRKLEAQLDKRIDSAVEYENLKKELTQIESQIKSQEEAPKRKLVEEKVKTKLKEQFDTIKVGDQIDVGGNNILTVAKKNTKSVITETGGKWTADEIINVIAKPMPEVVPKIEKVEAIPKKEPKVEISPEEVPTKPKHGMAWIKGKQKPILSAREITKGKNKGKFEVILTKGRDVEGNIIPGAKKIVAEKEIITMPIAEEKVFATKAIKPQDTITRSDLKKIFSGMKNVRTGVNPADNFYFKVEGRPAVEILEVDHIDGFIQMAGEGEKERIAVGSYLQNQIQLKTGGKGHTADINTAWHEFYHFLKKNGFISKNDSKALDNAIGKIEATEEDQATYVGDRLAAWRVEKNSRIKRILKKVADFANAIYEFFARTRTARGVLKDIERDRILREEASIPKERIISPVFQTKPVKEPSIIKEKFGRVEITAKEKIDSTFKSIKSKEFWDSAITQTVDRLHPIKAKIGDKAYKLHRLLTGSEATFSMLLEHGKLEWVNNEVLSVKTREKGFMPFLEKQGKDWKKLLYWTAAKRAAAIEVEDSTKGYKPGDREWREKWLDAKARKKIFEWAGDQYDPKMLKLSKELKAFNDNVLDIAEQSGLIDPSARKIWAQDFYIPFYRIFQDEKAKLELLKAPRKSGKIISAQIKKLKGGEKLGDPLENLFHNWMHLLQESTRNTARAEAFNSGVLKNSGLIKKVEFKDLHSFYRDGKNIFVHKKTNEDVLMFQKNGKPVYFRVSDVDLFNALSGVNSQQFDNFVMKLMNKTKRALTYGATFGPAFRVANLLRDTMHTALIQKTFKPFIDSAKGLVSAWTENQDFIEFMASGAGFGSSYVRADDPATASKFIQRIMKKEGAGALDRILSTGKKMLDFWEKVGSASENAARVQLYKTLKTKGKAPLEAAFEARDLLDFTMRGEAGAVQILIQTIPFLNARMQGLYKLGRSVADPTNRKNFATRGALLMAASLALWAIHKDDDEYKELENWDKWSYYHFWIGDKHYRIPKPFEVGAIFSSLPTAMADVLYGNDDTKHIADFLGYTAMETFAVGIPQAVKPLAEQWANKSFFTGRPIVGAHLKGLKPGEQKEPWTSETLQLAGKLGISPKRAEALIHGYFSVFGMFLLGGADIITHSIFDFPENPTLRIDDYPLLGRFVKEKEPRYTKQQTWFYETLNEIDVLVQTINHYKRTGEYKKARTLKMESQDILKFKTIFKKRQTQLRNINKQIKRIMINKLISPEQKRRKIDSLSKRRNMLVKQIYEYYLKR